MADSSARSTPQPGQQSQAQSLAQAQAGQSIIAALSSALQSSTGEKVHHDKIAQLLTANMDQLNALASAGRLTQTQIQQLKQFAANSQKATAQQNAQAALSSAGDASKPTQATVGISTPTLGTNGHTPATLTSNPGTAYPISQVLNVTNPGPQSFPQAVGRPTLSGGFAGGRISGTPSQIARSDDQSAVNNLDFSRRKNTASDQSMRKSIQDLVTSIDPNVKVDAEVEDLLLDIADEFIESVTNFGCRLAKHRGGDVLEIKDLQLHLERNHNIRIPGFASDETRISMSQIGIGQAPTGASGTGTGKKGAQNVAGTLRSQRLAQVAQAKKELKLM